MVYAFIMNLIIGSTIMAGLLAILILIVKQIFKNRFSAKWHYIIWFVLLLRLAVPYIVYSPLNISELFRGLYIESTSANEVGQQTPLSNTVSGTVDIPDKPESHSTLITNNEVNTNDKTARAMGNTLKQLIILISQIKINYQLVFLIWILGVAILSLYAFLYNIFFWTKVKNGSVFTDQKIIQILEECKQALNISTNISIIQTSGISIPAIFGVTRPWLLMPEKVLKNFEHENLRYIILHELAHLKRKDILINWIAFLLQIIHWFNPFVWLAFSKMRVDRELACDEVVLMHLDQEEVKKYGHTILDMVEIVSGKVSYAGITGILEDKSQIKDRISMISQFNKKNRKLSAISVIIVIVLVSSILVNASDFTGKTEMKEKTTTSSSILQKSTEKNLEVKATQSENEVNSLQSGSTKELNEKNKPLQDLNTPIKKPANKDVITTEKKATDTSNKKEITDSNEPKSTTTINNINNDVPQDNNQSELKDLKIITGINVTTDSLSKEHTVFIDKNKLPAKMPELINMSLISTDDISDSTIQNMVSYHKDHKIVSWQFDGRTGEYYRWGDDGKKYSIILLFDTDMNYLGYYIYENP